MDYRQSPMWGKFIEILEVVVNTTICHQYLCTKGDEDGEEADKHIEHVDEVDGHERSGRVQVVVGGGQNISSKYY